MSYGESSVIPNSTVENDLRETRVVNYNYPRKKFNVQTVPERDRFLTEFGMKTLSSRYLTPGETYQDLFARVAQHYADDEEHANRLYYYISNMWFMPATPILANGGTSRGLPISCYLNSVSDSMKSISATWIENIELASNGGGIGTCWSDVRSIGEMIGNIGQTSGIIPFIKVQDSLTLAISQGALRRGSSAVYLDVSHPEIEEFVEIRKASGGDPNRKALNIHNAVVIDDKFMVAVENDLDYDLVSPKTKEVIKTINARSLWIRILTARLETGEPYILFIDAVNRLIPEHHKKLGLYIKQSNLCSEITLPTGPDHLNMVRTAVCCLSSVNIEKYDEWSSNNIFIEDIMRMLDNVLNDFIAQTDGIIEFKNSNYSARMERSVGLGVMGFHSFLQSKGIPWESAPARSWNNYIFKYLNGKVNEASLKLGKEKGPCPDAQAAGSMHRFSNKMSIAPTASISIICGGVSPSIEPFVANSYIHKTLSGSFVIKNKYLERLLEEKGMNTSEVWNSIRANSGSVQHLDFLSQDEKDTFKTAFELNQNSIIDLAADRVPYICQSQSINLFLPANIHKKDLHAIHFRAWKKGLKSLYYCRSKSLQRAESVDKFISKPNHVAGEAEKEIDSNTPLQEIKTEDGDFNVNVDDCEACQ